MNMSNYEHQINRLATIDSEWQLKNICRTEASKFEAGYPIAGRTFYGPFNLPDGNGGRCLKVCWNYVGHDKQTYYQFIIPEDEYGQLKQRIQSGGIRILHINTIRSGSCPWWLKVRFSLYVPSDRFITIHGDVIQYDEIAEQLELF